MQLHRYNFYRKESKLDLLKYLFKYFIIVEILSIVLIVTLKDVSEDASMLYSAGYWAWILCSVLFCSC